METIFAFLAIIVSVLLVIDIRSNSKAIRELKEFIRVQEEIIRLHKSED